MEMQGILPSQALRAFIAAGHITAFGDRRVEPSQVQPASLDLRLGRLAYRVPASFLPGARFRVEERLDDLQMHALDLTDGAVLERGCVYIVPLVEGLRLPAGVSARANPKSSTGRLDVFARVITDGAQAFDDVPDGYTGPLYAEISPRTFSIRVRTGTRLVQIRLRRGAARDTDEAVRALNAADPLLGGAGAEQLADDIRGGLPFTVDVQGEASGSGALAARAGMPPIVGWRARKHAGLVDIERVNHYEPLDFWEPVFARKGGGVVLDPDDFYILATRESVAVPPTHAAEMLAYDTSVGEFRVHYAGFFDPGFGYASAGGSGSRAVLEVRTHEVPFLIDDGQIVGRLVFERMAALPDLLYGRDIQSNYQGQALALSKQFRR
ncbi:2'-deoxycytidine 5'-triphosphate deaminase [Futiania mangrovi]|uniref:2'-deoxycytidine 5'-triphosphate deaminase n=1 Tax=Futiania mangrovi TaxID=2959716 RepID=A0A9J6PFS2_9PROT|nr:2'-deoxycytidine 5'-triphosphate deaminase [Futiania mangrovii]MCP1337318.1 2'-deoxycytidine 5'-triphosphate deaminase [Futiania mangrovii]